MTENNLSAAGHKIPLVGELPLENERVFDNSSKPKPTRKIANLEVKFGDLTDKNYEQLRVINYLTLPVIYSEKFYTYLTDMRRYSKLAYVKDILVGAISCKEDTNKNGEKECYIMTITVLEPYRRCGVGSQLLQRATQDCMVQRDVKKMTLHVQQGNDSALNFYAKHGFQVVEELKDYYTDLQPSGCFVLEKII